MSRTYAVDAFQSILKLNFEKTEPISFLNIFPMFLLGRQGCNEGGNDDNKFILCFCLKLCLRSRIKEKLAVISKYNSFPAGVEKCSKFLIKRVKFYVKPFRFRKFIVQFDVSDSNFMHQIFVTFQIHEK